MLHETPPAAAYEFTLVPRRSLTPPSTVDGPPSPSDDSQDELRRRIALRREEAACSDSALSPPIPAFVRICFSGWNREDCRVAKKVLRRSAVKKFGASGYPDFTDPSFPRIFGRIACDAISEQ